MNWKKPRIVEGKKAEQRRFKRYGLTAPVFFCWSLRDGTFESGQGVTHDLSTGGVSVTAPLGPPIGTVVQMDIMVPNPAYGGTDVHLSGEGVVVRIGACAKGVSDSSAAGFSAAMQFRLESTEWVMSDRKERSAGRHRVN